MGSTSNEKEFEKILGDYEGHHYINFHVRNKNGKKIEIDNVLRFNARDKFRAIINGDTLPCVLYHVSEMNERLQIALVFRENKAIEELKTIQFRCDENKFCSGVLEMEIPKRYIQQCPNLVL